MVSLQIIKAFRFLLVFGNCAVAVSCSIFLPWVITSEACWTLWKICYNKASTSNPRNYALGGDLCGDLGLSVPGYYLAIRIVETMLLILCILQVNVCCDNMWLDKGKRPAVISFICALLACISLGLGFDHTERDEDDFWQGKELRLSTGPYLTILSLILSLILFVFHLKYDEVQIRSEKQKTTEKIARKDVSGEEGFQPDRRPPSEKQVKRSPLAKNSVAPTERGTTLPPSRVAPVSRGDRWTDSRPRTSDISPPPSPRLPPPSSYSSSSLPYSSLFLPPPSSLPPPSAIPPPSPRAHWDPLPPIHGEVTVESQNHNERSQQKTYYSDSSMDSDSGSSVSLSTGSEELATQRRTDAETAAVTGPLSVEDHSLMHHDVDAAAMPTEELYIDDLRSASRASYLHNQEMLMGRGGGSRHGELPLLENMPAYTLPPSRGLKTPVMPPPSYEEAQRGDFVDMPPPPVVSVPIGQVNFGQLQ